MIDVLRSEQRGRTRLPWLDSQHSFSFGGYYDPDRMGVSALRVINDDTVAPGGGFDSHGHRDMEILSYVKRGAIEHRDGMGNRGTVHAGEFQLMSAGSGITHSEYNPSPTQPLRFLQIWIAPDRTGLTPSYQQKRLARGPGMHLIAAADGPGGSLILHQDVCVYQWLAGTRPGQLELAAGRTLYVHAVDGTLSVNGVGLAAGDGARVMETTMVDFVSTGEAEALVFDLP